MKIFGNDLNVLKDLAVQAEGMLKTVPGAADVVAERVTGGNYLDIDIDREAAARYGVKVGDIQDVIETALGGETLSTAVEGRNRFPIRLRYLRDYRDNIPAIQRILIAGMSGAQVPLSLVTKLKISTGAPEINSEGGLLRSIVFLNVRGRDMGGFVGEAKQVLEKQLKLPPGYYVAWSGQWENQVRAKAAAADPGPGGDPDHLHPALLHLPLGAGGEHGDALGPLRPGGRGLPGEGAGLQHVGGRLGRLHRPLRDRRGDRGGDGDLPARGAGQEADQRPLHRAGHLRRHLRGGGAAGCGRS